MTHPTLYSYINANLLPNRPYAMLSHPIILKFLQIPVTIFLPTLQKRLTPCSRPKPNIAALFAAHLKMKTLPIAAHQKMKTVPIAAHPTWAKLG